MKSQLKKTILILAALSTGGCLSLANKDDIYLLKTETNEEISALKLSVQRLEEEVQDLRGQVDFVKTDTANQLSTLSSDVSSRITTVEAARAKDKEEVSKKFNVVLDEVTGTKPKRSSTASKTSKSIPPGAQVYVVRTGDTISKIARQHGVSPQELMDANGMDNPNLLAIGDQLVIPGTGSTASSSTNSSAE